MAMSDRRALVIGAGIGGLTAAIALRQAGYEVSVFEQAPELRQIQVGTGLHVWPNAMKAFRQLGLEDAVHEAGMEVRRVHFRRSNGSQIADLPVDEVGVRIGAPSVGIRRMHLHRVLVDAFGESSLELSSACTGFHQDSRGVTIQLADGREERGDLLVGADGLRSKVREQLLGFEEPLYHGYTSWLGLVESRHDQVKPDILTVVWGRGARFIYYHLEPDRIGWIGNADAVEGQQLAPAERRAQALEAFRGWMEPVEALIEATNDNLLFLMDLYDRDPVSRWGEGRVTLLGDAAHPMTPNIAQGACQAIEDSVVLMKALAGGSDVPAALRSYEQQRMARTAPIVKRARFFGSMGQWRNPLLCGIRDGFMQVAQRKIAKQEEKLFGYEV